MKDQETKRRLRGLELKVAYLMEMESIRSRYIPNSNFATAAAIHKVRNMADRRGIPSPV